MKEFEPKKLEEETKEFWKKKDIYKKVKEKRKDGPKFYFLQGPPFTSGEAHLGHAINHVIKDSVLRYKRMKGYNVWDKAGWDTHGLPVETKVQQKLGLKSKKDIEEMGLEDFIKECKKFVDWSQDEMTKILEDMGIWLDFKDPYVTYHNEYMQAVWFLIKEAYNKNLLYKGEKIVNWCPSCETALAGNAEVEYKQIQDPSIFVKFKLEDGRYIVIWTTTPWTLPANEAVAVNPKINYAEVEVETGKGKERWIFARDLVEELMDKFGYDYEIKEEYTGKELEGLKYEYPLEVEGQKDLGGEWLHKILTADMVTLDEGTGCVHMAPGHGEEDLEVGKKYGLPAFSPVNRQGIFDKRSGKYEKKFVFDANPRIIYDLDKKGLLVKKEDITHNYLHCERCKNKIIYRTTDQWFIEITKIRDDMIKANRGVDWVPNWAGEKRFARWLESVKDWCISRQRYWNTPLPVWVCKNCKHMFVAGNRKQLESVAKNKVPEELHRPYIDKVIVECDNCGGDMERVPDVMDVWLDSGSASWACLNYPVDKDKFGDYWPADFITEGSDQTRGWFYSLLGSSMVAFSKPPYKKVLYHGFVLDEKGNKMSKSLGNVVSPSDVMDKYSVDTMRFYLLWANIPWEDIKFVWEDVESIYKFFNILWNTCQFYRTYSTELTSLAEKGVKGKRLVDKWLISKVNSLNREVTAAYENLEPHNFTRPLVKFLVDDLSRWYIKSIRDRVKPTYEGKDKQAAFYTLSYALDRFLKLLSPVAPLITDSLYSGNEKSIHLCDWPRPERYRIDTGLENKMDVVMEIVEAGNSARQENEIGLRYPVKKATVSGDEKTVSVVREFKGLIKKMLNIRSLETGDVKLEYEVKPNYPKIGPKFGDETKKLTGLIQKNNENIKKQMSEKGKAKVGRYELDKEDVEIIEKVPEKLAGKKFKGGIVYLDMEETEDIIEERIVRETIRKVQELRKKKGLDVHQKIKLFLDPSAKKISGWEEEIKKETGSEEIVYRLKKPEGKSRYGPNKISFGIEVLK